MNLNVAADDAFGCLHVISQGPGVRRLDALNATLVETMELLYNAIRWIRKVRTYTFPAYASGPKQ
jgi:hypothetical protein